MTEANIFNRRIAVDTWTREWRAGYRAAPTRASLLVIVVALQDQAELMRTIRSGLPFVTAQHLRQWDRDFLTYEQRLKAYRSEISWDPSNPIATEKYARENVALPLLDGIYPGEPNSPVLDPWFIGLTPGDDLPDVTRAAMLWNQITAAAAAEKENRDWFVNNEVDVLILDWLAKALVELERSAPGEDPTMMDGAVEWVDRMANNVGELVVPIVVGGGLAAAAITIALLLWLMSD